MTGFSDIIKMIRAASSSDKPYYQAVQDVSRALCGHDVRTPSGGFKVICEALEEAHKKELDDMRRDVTDEAEEAKNLMIAQVVSSYNEQMEAIQEECEQKVKAAIDKSLDPQRLYGAKPNTFDGVLEALKEFRWQHATNDTDVIPYINRLKAVHDMEIQEVAAHYELDHCPSCKARLDQQDRAETMEHMRKEEYHRGYVDGLKSHEATTWKLEYERAKAASRLLKVSLDTGGAVKKLSVALGCEWNSPRAQRSLLDLRARLIYLLSGCYLFSGSNIDENIETRKIRDLEDEPTLQKTTNLANVDTIIELSNDYADLVAERDSILDLLRDAAKEYKELLDKYLAAPWEAMQPMDDEHMSRLGWMRALDRDGEPICMGDTVRNDEENAPFVGETFKVTQITHFRDGSCYVSGGWVSVSAKSVQCTHQETNPDPIEQTIRDLTLGEITETEAIERLHEIIGS